MRVLIVDDSLLFRHMMAEVLATLPNIEVVGQVSSGKLALQRICELHPDLLTLDMEMPEMDGFAVLEALKAIPDRPAVIVVSARNLQGRRLTLQALQTGAFDFITKPTAASIEESKRLIYEQLKPRLAVLARRREIQAILHPKTETAAPGGLPLPGRAPAQATLAHPRSLGRLCPQLILIGVSTGGPNALAVLIPQLPANLGVPILIVQHMPALFTADLAESLNTKSAIRVREASDGEQPQPNTAYIAPGGKQMRLAPRGASKVIQITDDPPENNCKPAVDYLLRSVANTSASRTLTIILTGMGSDGTAGLRLLKQHPCHSIAQDEASCVVYGMPRAAVEAGLIDDVLPLQQIAGRIVSIVRATS